jgi:hypothetical protein
MDLDHTSRSQSECLKDIERERELVLGGAQTTEVSDQPLKSNLLHVKESSLTRMKVESSAVRGSKKFTFGLQLCSNETVDISAFIEGCYVSRKDNPTNFVGKSRGRPFDDRSRRTASDCSVNREVAIGAFAPAVVPFLAHQPRSAKEPIDSGGLVASPKRQDAA